MSGLTVGSSKIPSTDREGLYSLWQIVGRTLNQSEHTLPDVANALGDRGVHSIDNGEEPVFAGSRGST